jgi:hypothetical protein
LDGRETDQPELYPEHLCPSVMGDLLYAFPASPRDQHPVRGYTAVAVFRLRGGALLFTRVQPDAGSAPGRTPIGPRMTLHFYASEWIVAHCRDSPIPRFVMMGSGVRIPLAAPRKRLISRSILYRFFVFLPVRAAREAPGKHAHRSLALPSPPPAGIATS